MYFTTKADGTELNGMGWNSRHAVITACHAIVASQFVADVNSCSASMLYAALAAASERFGAAKTRCSAIAETALQGAL